MNIDFLKMSFFKSEYLRFGKELNYKCIRDIGNSETASKYIKNVANTIIVATEFVSPLAKRILITAGIGYAMYELTKYITLKAITYLKDEYTDLDFSEETLKKLRVISKLMNYSAFLGTVVGPITPFSALLIISSGTLNSFTAS